MFGKQSCEVRTVKGDKYSFNTRSNMRARLYTHIVSTAAFTGYPVTKPFPSMVIPRQNPGPYDLLPP